MRVASCGAGRQRGGKAALGGVGDPAGSSDGFPGARPSELAALAVAVSGVQAGGTTQAGSPRSAWCSF